ncbi:MAG TPA: hypothetical protein VF221_06210 [Chloroflexota bacterium]
MKARRLVRGLLVLLVLVPAAGMSRPALAASVCAPHATRLSAGQGSPDDLLVDGSRILFSDIHSGTVASERGGRVTTLIGGLSTPEGMVLRNPDSLVVVEQGLNRLDRVDLRNGHRSVLLQMPNTTGQEGVDGIGQAPDGGIYIPDSPNGRLLLLNRGGRLTTLTTELSRPVDAISFQGGVAVADENANAIWLVHGGQVQRLATLSIPDDVVLFKGHLLAVTLGDKGLWEVWPHRRLLLGGWSSPQGLAASSSMGVLVADSNANGLFRVTGLASCL